ncbi:hypothetical protein [Leifsonia shinshuensis]|uniref:Uncharacterized protein n=1 Tax=Leifsonia shinshuensis TaxID=150026 RepID=A0A853CPK6_9MICO|nr:hypothetical protein [Leifsonia shinshuensis]NYJ22178.1 hypothetical protein [Leifsonia shinshuensis]
MKRIHYASGSVLTGDAIADVLVRYAAVLATNTAAAEVRAPVILHSGEVGEAVLLLGPASQILAESEPYDGPELRDTDFVDRLDDLVTSLGPRRATFVHAGTEELDDLDVDLL